MEDLKNVTRFDIEESLNTENFRISKIISLTLIGGPLFILLINLFIYYRKLSSGIPAKPFDDISLHIYVLIILVITVYPIFLIFPKIFLKPENLKSRMKELPTGTEDLPNSIIILDRILMIIRLAMLEGVSLFGVIILFLSISSGEIYYNDTLWFLITPWIIQTIYTLNNYLTKNQFIDRIENLFLT